MFEELCPHCNGLTDYSLKNIDPNGQIVCSSCGKRIHACQACFNECRDLNRKVCFYNPYKNIGENHEKNRFRKTYHVHITRTVETKIEVTNEKN